MLVWRLGIESGRHVAFGNRAPSSETVIRCTADTWRKGVDQTALRDIFRVENGRT